MDNLSYGEYSAYFSSNETRIYKRSKQVHYCKKRLSQSSFELVVDAFVDGIEQGIKTGRNQLAQEMRDLLQIETIVDKAVDSLHDQIRDLG